MTVSHKPASTSAVPVVIVGAGPTGCTAALLLAKLGIPTVLLERRRAPTFHPSAHVINARTLEVWAQISPDLAQEISSLSPTLEETREVAWCTSLYGRELGTIDLVPPPDKLAELFKLSAYRTMHLGQHRIEPILWKWVRNEPLIDFRSAVYVDEARTNDEGVEVEFGSSRDSRPGQTRVADRVNSGVAEAGRTAAGGVRSTIHARYLLACDGAGSSLRSKLGIPMRGATLAHVASVFFHAELPARMGKTLPVLAWIYNPDFAGVLINHLHGDFVLMGTYFPPVQDEIEFGPQYWSGAIPKALGIDGLPLKIKSCGTWTMTAQVAERFGNDRAFLLGDAAHRFPPTGGYGLNTGVQDAHNLAWKLAAVLEGRSGEALLRSYEQERRPIAQQNCEQSVRNHLKMDLVTKHFQVTGANLARLTRMVGRPPFSWLPESWQRGLVRRMMNAALRQTRRLQDEGTRGEALRAKVAAAIPEQIEHFGARGVEMGFSYASGLVKTEAGAKPIIGAGTLEYRPTTWPGARLPHLEILKDARKISVHDLLNQRDFIVLCGPEAASEWHRHIPFDALSPGLPLRVEALEATTEDEDAAGAWLRVFEVGRFGAVLVRPDGHVAWRTDRPARESASLLVKTANSLWCRPA